MVYASWDNSGLMKRWCDWDLFTSGQYAHALSHSQCWPGVWGVQGVCYISLAPVNFHFHPTPGLCLLGGIRHPTSPLQGLGYTEVRGLLWSVWWVWCGSRAYIYPTGTEESSRGCSLWARNIKSCNIVTPVLWAQAEPSVYGPCCSYTVHWRGFGTTDACHMTHVIDRCNLTGQPHTCKFSADQYRSAARGECYPKSPVEGSICAYRIIVTISYALILPKASLLL